MKLKKIFSSPVIIIMFSILFIIAAFVFSIQFNKLLNGSFISSIEVNTKKGIVTLKNIELIEYKNYYQINTKHLNDNNFIMINGCMVKIMNMFPPQTVYGQIKGEKFIWTIKQFDEYILAKDTSNLGNLWKDDPIFVLIPKEEFIFEE